MTESEPLLCLAPVCGLAAYCVAHVILSRAMPWRSPYPPLVSGSVFGLLAAVCITWAGIMRDAWTFGDGVALIAMNVTAYLALAFCYFNFVNLTVASLRIRMLEEMLDSPGPLPQAALLDRYDSSTVAALRIDRLLRGGHLIERNGRLHRGRLQFLLVARIFDVLHRIIVGVHRAGESRDDP